ncbi:hypothetical protein CRG98_047453 [Punica granatum]|nr:hypothetical protein CRG98_047453 [Punica granatum]
MTKKKPLKITYISSPVMVRATTASEFRAIVQELTGKDSDVGVLSPHDEEAGTINRELGTTQNVPADHTGFMANNFPANWPRTADDDRKCFYLDKAFDFPKNPMAVPGFGLDEVFSWKEFSEGFVGFQSSHYVST